MGGRLKVKGDIMRAAKAEGVLAAAGAVGGTMKANL
jgi:hypothetical protein